MHHRAVALLFAALAAVSCGGPAAPSSTGAPSTDPKDLAEALLLGSGPLSDSANRGCLASGLVAGWQYGTTLTLRVSSQLPPDVQTQIQQVVSRIAEATLGNLSASIQPTAEIDPQPGPGEVTVWGTTDPAKLSCTPGAILCTFLPGFKSPFIHAARIVGQPIGDFAHELGHGVFGFCHARTPNVFGKETIMVGGSGLTDRDVGIIQSVYRAGLGPGATRPDLVKAGIVNP